MKNCKSGSVFRTSSLAGMFAQSALTLACLIALLLSGPRCAASGWDPWYIDADGHWAWSYIRVLWEEGVTDGVISVTNPGISWYYPDRYVTRAQFIVLLAKVFGLPPATPPYPSYPDVPENYNMLAGKPAWSLIEGALAGGISLVAPGDMFFPDSYTTREEAVAFLIRSLDLEPHSEAMSSQEVVNILMRFKDWYNISPGRRNAMACAVRFGIIEGYDDGTVKPGRFMTRAEAATVVYRSCLVRFSARKDKFSPDGDGVDDTVTFDFTYLKNQSVVAWQAVIATESLSPVYYFNPSQIPGQPPAVVSWDGRDNAGNPLPPGLYVYQARVQDARGRVFFSVTKPLYLEIHSLEASLYPTECVDGQTLTVIAETVPQASRVTAQFAAGPARTLSSSDGKTWVIEVTVGPPLPLGRQPVTITADFPDTTRTKTVYFERVQDTWLLAAVEPNPASWNQLLRLEALTSHSVTEVTVSLFEEDTVLGQSSQGAWTGQRQVPFGIPSGFYPAVFTGKAEDGKTVSATVWLEVRDPESEEIVYVLSK
ncbi:MAG TPA: hypothetical protein GX500_07105 [Firmicutes bacterium]|nr:hypothetical protein [Candidatus Fermentithermobacillaceae bacterium]